RPSQIGGPRSPASATSIECCAAARGPPTRSSPGPPSATGIFRSGGRSSPASGARAMPSAATEPALYEATRRGLQAEPKRLPTVWLYDERGSRLYEEITRLPEYYLPRREREILRLRAVDTAARTPHPT